MILWCNNTASWWPDIPVVIAILSATIIMAIVCWDVYWKEKASARWRGGGAAGGERARNRLSSQVFWQSFWYLMAFYLTWPAYLALQYAWASDNYFTQYGLVLTGGTMVPLQGFWNAFAYVRNRHLKRATASIRQASVRVLGRFQTTQTATSSRDSTTRSFAARFRISRQQSRSTRYSSETATSHNMASRQSSRPASTENPDPTGIDDHMKPESVRAGGVGPIDEESADHNAMIDSMDEADEEVANCALTTEESAPVVVTSKDKATGVPDRIKESLTDDVAVAVEDP